MMGDKTNTRDDEHIGTSPVIAVVVIAVILKLFGE